MRATCPEHGLIEFEWKPMARWWVCPVYTGCCAVISYETFILVRDGGTVENSREVAARRAGAGWDEQAVWARTKYRAEASGEG
jgi:hypothetical protein